MFRLPVEQECWYSIHGFLADLKTWTRSTSFSKQLDQTSTDELITNAKTWSGSMDQDGVFGVTLFKGALYRQFNSTNPSPAVNGVESGLAHILARRRVRTGTSNPKARTSAVYS
jgi:hypothetical protein